MMQNRSVNERVLNVRPGLCTLANKNNGKCNNQEGLYQEHTFTSFEDDPLLIMTADAAKTYDKTNTKQINENVPHESSRKQKYKVSKGRKHRGKQEIQATG